MSGDSQTRRRLFFNLKLTTRHFVAWCIAVFLVVAGATGASVAGVTVFADGAEDDADRRPDPLPVETQAVSFVNQITVTRTYTGTIRAARQAQLGFDRMARLIEVAVDEGDRVAPGDVLARLDTRDLEARQRELQAERAAAAALLDELISGPRRETIAAAQALVDQLSAELKRSESDLVRAERLADSQAISKADIDAQRFGAQASRSRLAVAQQQLAELEAGTRKERIEAQRAQVSRLDAMLAQIAVDIEDSTLVAPFTGTISRRLADEGAVVAIGLPLLSLVEDGRLEAWIGLPAATAISMKLEESHELIVAGSRYPATVSAILPELDPETRTRTVVLDIDPAARGGLVPAQVVRIEINERVEMEGAWLPLSALARGSHGLWSAYVVETEAEAAGGEGVVERREVEVLHTDGDRVFVRGTLSSGDLVVRTGTHRIVAGQSVRFPRAWNLAAN